MLSCQNLEQAFEAKSTQKKAYQSETVFIDFELQVGSELHWLVDKGMAIGVEIYSQESGLLDRREWLDYLVNVDSLNEDREGKLTLTSLLSLELSKGSYKIRTFFKEDKLNLDDHSDIPHPSPCPTPLGLHSPLSSRQFDIAEAFWLGRVDRNLTLEFSFKQKTCGMGDLNTALKGQLSIPNELNDTAQQRIMIHFTPLVPSSGYPLTIPLKRYMQHFDEPNLLQFYVNQLPEGSYRLTIFVDSDGDALPTPCNRQKGQGGDQWISAESVNIALARGETYLLEQPINVSYVEECSGLLTNLGNEDGSGVSSKPSIFLGQVDLDPVLRSAVRLSPTQAIWFSNQRRHLPPFRFVEGKKLFTLQEAIIADGRFSVHLAPTSSTEQHEFAIWIDEGTDQNLSPCDNLDDLGSDLWWWFGDRQQFGQLLNLDLESPPPLELINISRRCSEPSSVVEITMNLNFTWPELSTTRPLILVYEDILSGQVYESLIKDINLENLEEPLTIRRRLQPGAYLLSAYIDQDLDLQFTPCTEQYLGDRLSSTRATIVSLSSGEVEEVTLALAPRECPESKTVPIIHFISPLTNEALAQHEVGDETVQCSSQTTLLRLIDPHILGSSRVEEIELFSSCVSLFEEEQNIPALPAGIYQAQVCIPIARDLQTELLGDSCSTPRFWLGTQEFTLTDVPVQQINLPLTASCTCDLDLSK